LQFCPSPWRYNVHLNSVLIRGMDIGRRTTVSSDFIVVLLCYRRFAVQCLHSKVIPILAGIIAFIDTNRNLNILTRHDLQSWQIDQNNCLITHIFFRLLCCFKGFIYLSIYQPRKWHDSRKNFVLNLSDHLMFNIYDVVIKSTVT
jgi:hypothetical protein